MRAFSKTDPFRPSPAWDAPTTELWLAIVAHGDPERVRAAIAKGARLDALNPRGVSFAHAAVYHDTSDHQIISALLDAGAPLFEANGQSPAMDSARRFLDNGAYFRFLQARVLAAQEKTALETELPASTARAAPRV